MWYHGKIERERKRERESEREKQGQYGIFDNISYLKEKRQQLRCYEDTEFLGAKQYDKRPQNNDTLIVQTRTAYRYQPYNETFKMTSVEWYQKQDILYHYITYVL